MNRWARETLHLWCSIPVMLALAFSAGAVLWFSPVGAPPGTTAYFPRSQSEPKPTCGHPLQRRPGQLRQCAHRESTMSPRLGTILTQARNHNPGEQSRKQPRPWRQEIQPLFFPATMTKGFRSPFPAQRVCRSFLSPRHGHHEWFFSSGKLHQHKGVRNI